MSDFPTQNFAEQLHRHYGPTLGGQDLYRALGFRSYSAFHRSKEKGEIGVHVFKIAGRRGWFAMTSEVAEWLEKQRNAPV